jgi:hypothetical protein
MSLFSIAEEMDMNREPERQRHRMEPRHPDDVESQPQGASNPEEPTQGVPDASPGREYQGTGIPNRHGRFGSSEVPADPVRKPGKRSP